MKEEREEKKGEEKEKKEVEEKEEEKGNHMLLRKRPGARLPEVNSWLHLLLPMGLGQVDFSLPQFLHLYNEANKITCRVFMRRNELILSV